MSDPKDDSRAVEIVDVDIRAWVEAARANPALYRDRQVTEIVLAAIGLTPSLHRTLVLKGGALMALAFGSHRLTTDVDFTAMAEPGGFAQLLTDELNAQMPRTAIELGHADLVCRIQTVEKKPRPQNFTGHDFPALLVRIASATRGTNEQKRLNAGNASRVLDIEISFRDQVYESQQLNLTDAGVSVCAFTIHELIAEKLRALLQQVARKRNRRQDIYDIAFLLEGHQMGPDDRAAIHDTLVKKCRTRGIEPGADSLDDAELVRRARADWDTLKLEVPDLPPFDRQYAIVRDFYATLPWRDG